MDEKLHTNTSSIRRVPGVDTRSSVLVLVLRNLTVTLTNGNNQITKNFVSKYRELPKIFRKVTSLTFVCVFTLS